MGKGNRARNQRASNALATSGANKNKRNQKGMPTWVGTLIVVVVLVVLLLFVTVLTLNKRGVFTRMNTIMRSENYEITIPMLSYILYSEYQETVDYYKQYSSQLGYNISIGGGENGDPLDTTKNLRDQVYSRAEKNGAVTMTWFDYFLAGTIDQTEQMLAMCEEAKHYGMSLNESDIAQIEAELSTIELYAQLNGLSTTGYLSIYYGTGVQLKDVRNVLEISQLAGKFANQRMQELKDSLTDDQIADYYEENKATYDVYMDYVGYKWTATFKPSTGKDASGNALSDADKLAENEKNNEKYKAEQEKYAARVTALENATTIEEFRALLTQYLREDAYEIEKKALMTEKKYDSDDKLTAEDIEKIEENTNNAVLEAMKAATVGSYKKGTAAGDMDNWLFETKEEGEGDNKVVTNIRVVGDKKKFETKTDVTTTGDDAYGKTVTSTYQVCWVTATQHRSELPSVGHILFKSETYKDLTSTSKLSGVKKVLADEVLAANGKVTAKGMADRLLAIMLEEGYITKNVEDNGYVWYSIEEDVFNEFGSYYTDDSNVFYDDQRIGTFVTPFDNWRIDDARREGEISYPNAVETEFGYHIMYYRGVQWSHEIGNTIVENQYTEYCEDLLEKYQPSLSFDEGDVKYISG